MDRWDDVSVIKLPIHDIRNINHIKKQIHVDRFRNIGVLISPIQYMYNGKNKNQNWIHNICEKNLAMESTCTVAIISEVCICGLWHGARPRHLPLHAFLQDDAIWWCWWDVTIAAWNASKTTITGMADQLLEVRDSDPTENAKNSEGKALENDLRANVKPNTGCAGRVPRSHLSQTLATLSYSIQEALHHRWHRQRPADLSLR